MDNEYQEVRVSEIQVTASIETNNDPRTRLGHFFQSGNTEDDRTRNFIDSISYNPSQGLMRSARESEFFRPGLVRKKPTLISSIISGSEFMKNSDVNDYFVEPIQRNRLNTQDSQTLTPIITSSEQEHFTPVDVPSNSMSPGLRAEDILRPESIRLLAGDNISSNRKAKGLNLALYNSEMWPENNRPSRDLNQGLIASVLDNDFKEGVPVDVQENFVVEMVDDIALVPQNSPLDSNRISVEMVDESFRNSVAE